MLGSRFNLIFIIELMIKLICLILLNYCLKLGRRVIIIILILLFFTFYSHGVLGSSYNLKLKWP